MSTSQARYSPLVTHGKFTPCPYEIRRDRARDMFTQWLRGQSFEEIATVQMLTAEDAHRIVMWHVRANWRAWYKWRLAELRCKAMAMELRLLRIGKDAEPDQPIETLDPPKPWLDALKTAGIDTVRQLRSVDPELLYSQWRFPAGAVAWAILNLDKLGLSHALTARLKRRPNRRAPDRIQSPHFYIK